MLIVTALVAWSPNMHRPLHTPHTHTSAHHHPRPMQISPENWELFAGFFLAQHARGSAPRSVARWQVWEGKFVENWNPNVFQIGVNFVLLAVQAERRGFFLHGAGDGGRGHNCCSGFDRLPLSLSWKQSSSSGERRL